MGQEYNEILSISWPHPTWCGMWVQLVYSYITWKLLVNQMHQVQQGYDLYFQRGAEVGAGWGWGGQTLEGSLQVQFPL
jgi:hypothetical protein